MRASGGCPLCIERHSRRSWQGLGVCSVTIRPKPARSASGSGGFRRNAAAGLDAPARSKKAVPERTALMVYKGEIRAGDRSGGRSGRRGRFHFRRTDRTGSGRWDGSRWGSDDPAAGRSQAGVPASSSPPGRSHRSFRSSDRLENTGYHTGTPAQKTDGYIHWCGSAAFPDGFRSPDRPDLSAVQRSLLPFPAPPIKNILSASVHDFFTFIMP